MASYTRYYLAASGGTYRAFPVNRALADWATYAVTPTFSEGAYAFVLNENHGESWAVFSGGSAPASLDLYVHTFELYGSQLKALAQSIVDVLPADSQRIPGVDDLDAAGAEITSVDPEAAAMIAAHIVAARGDYYPPRARVWVLHRTSSGIGVMNNVELSKGPDDANDRFYVDWAAVLGRNEAIQSLDDITGTGAAFLETDSEGITGNLTYFAVTGGTDGAQLEFELEVTTTEEAELHAKVLLNVVAP